jgi:hypothetical protein
MRFFLQAVTYNYKVYHSLSKYIKTNLPNSEFAIHIGGIKGKSEDINNYFNNQDDINYKIYQRVESDNLFEYQSKNTFKTFVNNLNEPDYKLLNDFEKNIDSKSIWQTVAADRFLGRSYYNGVIGYNFIKKQDKEFIIKYFSYRLKLLKEYFDSFKPDIFLAAIAQGSIDVHIYYYLCKINGTKYIVSQNCRTKNYFSFSNDLSLNFKMISEVTKKNLLNPDQKNLLKAKNLYKDINNFKKFKAFYSEDKIFIPRNFISNIFYLFIKLPLISTSIFLNYKKKLNFYNSINITYEYILMQLQRIWLPKLGEKLHKNQKYIYYPIHVNPEYSTTVMGTMWQDQIQVIEILAKSIPSDWIVYVKEHPGILTARVRPRNFHNRLKKIPNVKIAPIYSDVEKIIENSEMIASVTGTAAWEGVLKKKPVITFVENMFDVLNLSKKCSDLNMLSKDINEEYFRYKNLTNSEIEKRIYAFLSAIISHAFLASFPKQLNLEPGKDDQFYLTGQELGKALLKYLKYIDN